MKKFILLTAPFIFFSCSISEMEEVVDMETLDGKQDLEFTTEAKSGLRQLPKRSRFVPLQKFTLNFQRNSKLTG